VLNRHLFKIQSTPAQAESRLLWLCTMYAYVNIREVDDIENKELKERKQDAGKSRRRQRRYASLLLEQCNESAAGFGKTRMMINPSSILCRRSKHEALNSQPAIRTAEIFCLELDVAVSFRFFSTYQARSMSQIYSQMRDFKRKQGMFPLVEIIRLILILSSH